MKLGAGVHLTYCSNIHPGESWAEVRDNLERHTTAVRDRLAPGAEFGIGLRLSARAANELAEPAALQAFREFLARERMYVFTINGFPYGTFHGTRVKDAVYLPDWRSAERLRYSNRLADLLAALLPEDPALEGSVSTVPGGYKAALDGPRDGALIAEHLLQHVAHLVALRERTDRRVALALEPEPCCLLETIDETVAFFRQHLHGAAAARRVAELSGLGVEAAAQALHQHLGVCLDLCHAAVEFEDPRECLRRLSTAGIRVHKLQISAGLQLAALTPETLAALRRFDDPVYLHQVIERSSMGLRRFTDLPDAFASLDGTAANRGHENVSASREWRVHFHVPIFMDQLAPFASTQAFIRDVLALHRAEAVSAHLEVETYTWDVLPPALRAGPVDEAVARELAWVRKELAA